MNVFHHQNYFKNTIGLKNQKTISLILKKFNHQLQGLPWIIPCLFIGMHANQVLSPIIEVKQMQEYSKVCLFDSMSNQISNHVREVSITPYFLTHVDAQSSISIQWFGCLHRPSGWYCLIKETLYLKKKKERKSFNVIHSALTWESPHGVHL